MNERFHVLVDKKLFGNITKEEESELQEIHDYYDFMDIDEINYLEEKIKKYNLLLEWLEMLLKKIKSK